MSVSSRDGEPGGPGIRRIRARFGRMLDAGRHVFEVASNALVGGTDPEVIRKDLFETDRRINETEHLIRREIIVHASVHGAAVLTDSLVLMSISKDAERIGDYAKNLFDLADAGIGFDKDAHHARLVELKDRLSRILAGCREVFDTQEPEQARHVIREAQEAEDACDEQILRLLRGEDQGPLCVAHALAYRYFKRTAGHCRNIASSIVQPVDKIDFYAKPEGGEA